MIVLGMVVGPGQAMAQRPLGVDVSSYQGSAYNWTLAKSQGIVFAWAKATEGTIAAGYHVDADFTINENNGKSAGVYIGAYHFAHPAVDSPGSEASFFWSTAGSYILADGKTLMPMLDMEVFTGVTGATTYSQWVNDWCTDIIVDAANAGVTVKPVIYVSACNAGNFDTSVGQWFSDIADYNGQSAQTGTPWSVCGGQDVWGSGVWHFWQYSDAGSYGGQSVDSDVYNGTLAGLTSTMIATTSGSGAIYYWDPQGTTGANPYTGSMTGTWETAKWTGSSAGQASPIAWVEGKAACFGVNTGNGTPAYTVTMNSNHVVAGFFDGPLNPNSCNVTINGSGVISLASGAQALDVINASDGSLGVLTINTVIAGDGQLVPEGNGQSYLNGANTYSGGTALGYSTVPWNGTVNFNNGSSFGTGTITLQNVGNGGALVVEGTSAINITNPVTVASATTNNIVGNAAGLTFSGPWSLGAAVSLGSGGAANNLVAISGVVSGGSALTKYNPGILSLNGVNTYSGATTISAGTLTIGGAGQLGAGSYAGKITNNATFNYASSATQTLSGIISGTGALHQSGPGKLTLNAANTYTGATTVSGGTLALGGSGSIGGSAVTVSSGATLANAATTTRTIGGATVLNSGGFASFTATGPGTLGKISVTGNLTLNGNAITVNLSGSSLAVGTYRLMDCTGTLSGSANATPTITGTVLTAGFTASVTTTTGSAGHFDLVIAKSAPSFANLTVSQSITYGTPSITLGGTLSASGPVYPASGETITVTINGNAQTTSINDSTGDFSINYNTSTLPASGAAYTITCSYPGDGALTGASDASTTLTVNPRPVVLAGTRAYDGTAIATNSILSVVNKVGSDVVNVASGSATLAGASVGPEAITSVGTLALGGAAAANYTLAGASGSVTITAATFSITGEYVDSTGSNFVITWQSIPGSTYHVVGNTNVAAALNTWTNVSGQITAADTNTSFTNPITSPVGVFEVISP